MTFAKIDEIVLPFAPLKVNLDSLSPEGRLLTEEQVTKTIDSIERIKNASASALKKASFARRFKKEELNAPYSIIVFGENYYAIYHGAKQNAHLGMGGFGYVKLAQNIKTGAWVVLKLTIPDKKQNEYVMLQKVELALGYLERRVSDHSYFIEYQKKMHEHGFGTWWINDQANLLMELADGVSLAELSKNDYALSADKWIEIILQVLKAYKDIKDKNIRHEDLKLENIFYSFNKNKATIIDFGSSTKKGFSLKKSKMIYTPGYTAPEIALKKNYSEASDIYALGATFFYLLKLADPKQSLIKDATLYKELYDYCFSHMSHKSVKKRPSTEEAIQFFEVIQHAHSNILPKPFRKIGLLSVDEYLHYINEAKSIDENSCSSPDISNIAIHDEETSIPSEQGGFFTNLLATGLQRLGSYFSLATQASQEIESPDKSIEKENESIPQEEPKRRYDHSFQSALKLFDEIWLIDSAKRTKKEYIQLRRELEEQRIVVGDRCFLSEKNALTETIPSILEKLGKEHSNKYNKYFCVTAQTGMQLPPDICQLTLQPEQDDSYYQKIIETYTANDIQEEYQNIKASLSKLANQYDVVKNTLEDFDARFSEGKLSLEHVKNSLNQLKKTLPSLEDEKSSLTSSTHSHAAFFPKLLPKKSQSNKLIKQIDSQIDEWVRSYQM